MEWGNPIALFGLALVPVVALSLWWSYRRRQKAALEFADQAVLGRLLPAASRSRAWAKSVLACLAVLALTIAAARPRFFDGFEEVAQRGADIYVILDVSRSMLADDVRPNRLQRAKSDINDLLEPLAGDRVGLIVFAGFPVLQVPLTTDHNYLRSALKEIDTDTVPKGGSMIGDAIRKAMDAFPPNVDRDQMIVLISDGEDQQSMPVEAAKQAAARGIGLITIGLGDTETGARVPGEKGQFTQYQGETVWSRLDESQLQQIADAANGVYIPARTSTYDLGVVYQQHLSGLRRGELRIEQDRRYREQFQWFVLIGVVCLMADLCLSSYRGGSPAIDPHAPSNEANGREEKQP